MQTISEKNEEEELTAEQPDTQSPHRSPAATA